MNRTIFIMVFMVMLTAVCPSAKVMAQNQKPLLGYLQNLVYPSAKAMVPDQKPLIEYVQNLQMAEDILRPQAKQLTITRDPFKPIITPAPKPKTTLSGKKPVVALPEDRLNDVLVIGIVRLDQEYRAYIKVGSKARVVNLQDTIRKYTIIGIDMDQIVFKSGNKEIIKKRSHL